MPGLETLVVGSVELLDGPHWAGVFECLKQFRHFMTFKIYNSPAFFHSWEVCLVDNVETVDYIMHGGRYPCLSADQPTSASEAYMLQIDASLRDRLRRIKRSRNQPTM